MRIIGLLEADFNTALKILFAQELTWAVEETGLSPDQWGGRVNKSAPDCATRKVIIWEYARFIKKTAGSFFRDLASCFDDMLRRLSAVVARKNGVSEEACVMQGATLQRK